MKDRMIMFDLDGTLWDSADNVAVSWNIIIDGAGISRIPLTGDDIRSVMGKTMEEIAEILFPGLDEGVRREVSLKCQEYENEYISVHGGDLFEKVRETLSEMKSAGWRMAVVSNCQTGYIPAFLKSMEMQDFFEDYEEWGNTLMPKAYNIRLVMQRNGITDAVYVGDTAKDKEAAEGAGIPFIFAEYGFGDIPDANLRIKSFGDLPATVQKAFV